MNVWMTGAMVVACSLSAVAANLDQGTKELRLDGDIDFDTAAGDSIQLDMGLGYFVADNLEVGGVAGLADDDRLTLWRLGAFGELNLPVEDLPVVPFVGAGLAWAYADPDRGDSEDALVLGLAGGAKYFVTEDLAIALQLNYQFASEDIFDEEDGLSDTNWDFTLGLRYYFDSPVSSGG
ncbi:MAG: outer membrane beta-barrel protein [Lentisphaerae bacterium]|nr:outer membrane beta-barrel protein [Lentisphaerota bacterium]